MSRNNHSSLQGWRGLLLVFCLGSSAFSVQAADKPQWYKAAYHPSDKTSLKTLANRHYVLFDHFLKSALSGDGEKDFMKVAAKVKLNIQWRDDNGTNIYNDAFRRSYPFVTKMDLKGMPDSIMLIAYLESQWHGKKGKKSKDYGYWQFVPEVMHEIQQLDYVPATIKNADIDKVRVDETLSTEAAQVHLHRYHFYFANVAKYPESEAWLLTFTAFNWGVGNVKRLLADLETQGIEPTYSNFYHALYQLYQKNKGDRSIRAAVEYVPNLWNLAQLLKKANG